MAYSALQLVYGQIPGAMMTEDLLFVLENSVGALALWRDIVKIRVEAKDYLVFGRLLRPPQPTGPLTTISMCGNKPLNHFPCCPVETVVANVYQAPNGSIALIVANHATETAKYDRPNACNLCHLDKTLGWTAEHLHEWYKQPKPELDAEQREISQAVLHLLKGDAAQRGLTAWGASWPPAVEASGRDWIAPYLALLLDDPYSAVRSMAWQSLSTFDEYQEFEYDFVAAPDERKAAALAALERWEGPVGTAKRDSVLMDGPKWNRARADAIRAQRDDRPISLLE